ncbi:hypothetical protein COCMIDRAFT_38863 [Bipolaris oryzae ATCC 44560]|uniref:Ribonucleases P/MRP subunit Pop8-like domain-containing protein n=1 Tax=Bipolaris oryzae ATCC 44560 TaxID=930090 RepID=W6ZI57_COCMI|nr:uncharacterized protein COCMIDRAFT_38863 [Bipolaris oryzae ATCC 44560]EUC43191.1 hypothetical protein COCMIDRAFT_38863 [Bipolaris oryzae ATCC 44560]
MAQDNAPNVAPNNPPAHTDTDADTSMPDAATPKPASKPEKPAHILHQTTLRKPTWSYLHLTLTSPSFPSSTSSASTTTPTTDISPLLISPLLTSALRAYLGTMGAAIPVDILKTAGREVWIRVPRQDVRGVKAALGSWVGRVEGEDVGGEAGRVGVAWRVVGGAGVLGGMGDGGEVFG